MLNLRPLLDVIREVVSMVREEVELGAHQEEVKLRSYEWLERELADPKSTHVQVVPDNRFHPGKIHVFHYNPKYKDVLDYYDTHPVMLHLGTIMRGKSRLELGVNLTWYPTAARRYLVERVREMYATKYEDAERGNPERALDQQKVFLNVYRLRYYLDHLGFSFAIRQYIPHRVTSERAVIEYESWERAVELDVPGVFPELKGHRNRSWIHQEFFRRLRVLNQDRGRLRQRVNEQRRTGSLYRFVDGNPLS